MLSCNFGLRLIVEEQCFQFNLYTFYTIIRTVDFTCQRGQQVPGRPLMVDTCLGQPHHKLLRLLSTWFSSSLGLCLLALLPFVFVRMKSSSVGGVASLLVQFCRISVPCFFLTCLNTVSVYDEKSTRTLGVLNVDEQKERFNVKNTNKQAPRSTTSQ